MHLKVYNFWRNELSKGFSTSKNIKAAWMSPLGWIEKMMELAEKAKLTALIRDKNVNSFVVRNRFWAFCMGGEKTIYFS